MANKLIDKKVNPKQGHVFVKVHGNTTFIELSRTKPKALPLEKVETIQNLCFIYFPLWDLFYLK